MSLSSIVLILQSGHEVVHWLALKGSLSVKSIRYKTLENATLVRRVSIKRRSLNPGAVGGWFCTVSAAVSRRR